MYEFVDNVRLNFLGGACQHLCSYCYTSTLKNRFASIKKIYSGEPYLIEKAFKKNLGQGHTYFVGSMTDMFADNVPDHMIIRILEHLCRYDNEYLLQTKNPERYQHFTDYYPMKVILATTIETDNAQILKRITDNNAILPRFRAYWTKVMSRLKYKTMVTMEPIMTFNLDKIVTWMKDINPIQVNIGANSNPKIKLPEPTGEEIGVLVKALRSAGIPVHLKDTLNRLYEG
jgi:DNA repair photolyase